jgi:hypothetical protein
MRDTAQPIQAMGSRYSDSPGRWTYRLILKKTVMDPNLGQWISSYEIQKLLPVQ